MSIEAMKQALELLAVATFHSPELQAKRTEVIERGLQAIAQAEKQEQDEPVAWRFRTGTFWNREVHWRYVLSLEGTEGLRGLEPLYTTPQPKREWVGLTAEEREQVQSESYGKVPHYVALIAAVESKLKEKNT